CAGGGLAHLPFVPCTTLVTHRSVRLRKRDNRSILVIPSSAIGEAFCALRVGLFSPIQPLRGYSSAHRDYAARCRITTPFVFSPPLANCCVDERSSMCHCSLERLVLFRIVARRRHDDEIIINRASAAYPGGTWPYDRPVQGLGQACGRLVSSGTR